MSSGFEVLQRAPHLELRLCLQSNACHPNYVWTDYFFPACWLRKWYRSFGRPNENVGFVRSPHLGLGGWAQTGSTRAATSEGVLHSSSFSSSQDAVACSVAVRFHLSRRRNVCVSPPLGMARSPFEVSSYLCRFFHPAVSLTLILIDTNTITLSLSFLALFCPFSSSQTFKKKKKKALNDLHESLKLCQKSKNLKWMRFCNGEKNLFFGCS